MVKFTNEPVSKAFEATTEQDVVIHAPMYNGLLSNITLEAAQYLAKVGDANIKAKTEKPKPISLDK